MTLLNSRHHITPLSRFFIWIILMFTVNKKMEKSNVRDEKIRRVLNRRLGSYGICV